MGRRWLLDSFDWEGPDVIRILHRLTLLLILLAFPISCATAPEPEEEVKSMETIGQVDRVDTRIDRLVPEDAVIEKLAAGFDWSEGPLWWRAETSLLFSDVPQNVVYRYRDGEGVTEFLRPSGHTHDGPPGREPGSNGLTFDLQGRLILCQHGNRQVARLEADGSFTTLASHYDGKRLNSPNDVVVKSNGDIYFTDPPYGLTGLNDSPDKELPFNGVFRLRPDGELTLLTREMTFPNGLAFSPDESILYIANSDPQKAIWMAYPVLEDGTLGEGKLFFDATPWVPEFRGLPDGLKVDLEGNLFATGPGGVIVFSPEGDLLGRINPGVATANCAWGNDGATLYLTADMYLARIRLSTRGY